MRRMYTRHPVSAKWPSRITDWMMPGAEVSQSCMVEKCGVLKRTSYQAQLLVPSLSGPAIYTPGYGQYWLCTSHALAPYTTKAEQAILLSQNFTLPCLNFNTVVHAFNTISMRGIRFKKSVGISDLTIGRAVTAELEMAIRQAYRRKNTKSMGNPQFHAKTTPE
jgi:hypothetical protein